MNKAHVWRATLNRLRRELTVSQVNAWFSGAHLVDVSDGVATLQAPSSYEKQLLETRYRETIERALTDTLGESVTVHVTVGTTRHTSHAAERAEKYQAAYSTPLFADDVNGADVAGGADDADDEDNEPTAPSNAPRQPNMPMRPHYAAARPAQPTPPLNRARAAGGASGERLGSIAMNRSSNNGVRRITPNPTGPVGSDREQRSERDTRDTRASGIWRDTPPPRVGEAPNMNKPSDDGPDGESGMGADGAGDPGLFPREHNGADAGNSSQSGASIPLALPRLNERYIFEKFIVGNTNQLAHAASRAVADDPGHAYNPLFLYSNVGLGKTHLLHAIGHTALAKGLSVLYVSSETFTNEIVDAIRFRTTEEFRAKYRSADVLLVDDIQFIAGKDSTEQEFFHTFNSLYETNRQIVMCSDRPPAAIVSLEERLRSRFEWGLIADIQPPDQALRVAILRAKSDEAPHHIPDEIIDYLANRVQSNIRELEGSLNRVLAFARLQGMPLTLDTAKTAMANLANDTRQRRVSIEDILTAVAEFYHIPVDDMRGKARDKQIVTPRHIAMYLMRQDTEASLLEIGQALGGRDHSTVLHGCEKIAREINENTTLRKEVLVIRQSLAG